MTMQTYTFRPRDFVVYEVSSYARPTCIHDVPKKSGRKEHLQFIKKLFMERWKWFHKLDRSLTPQEYEEILLVFMTVLSLHQRTHEQSAKKSNKKETE